ncbi:MAG: NAD-dependent deacetylase [Candidatus Melainabacteria bacterium]|nr:MAG: NAD-dependent deacetylase [Candidatus Melainabacteria bacterium]
MQSFSTLELEKIAERAAKKLVRADALLIGAGAGMGVDSGLPDFRGENGFWKAYPPFRGRKYSEITSPTMLDENPEQAWGFFSHCMVMYRNTAPHKGYETLLNWTKEHFSNYFVFTSNIDGHFAKSNFDPERIYEIHGNTHYMQCGKGLLCSKDIWSAGDIDLPIEVDTMRAQGELPKCPRCNYLARPNILLFGDRAFNPLRVVEQEHLYKKWRRDNDQARIVALEFGAGEAVPTVRYECQRIGSPLIRVNPTDFGASIDSISFPAPACVAIGLIDKHLGKTP